MRQENTETIDSSGKTDSLHACRATMHLRIEMHDGGIEKVERTARENVLTDSGFVVSNRNVSYRFLLRDVASPKKGCEELAEGEPVDTGKHDDIPIVLSDMDSAFVPLEDSDCVVVYREVGVFTIATDDGVIVDPASVPVGRSVSGKQKRLLVCGKRIEPFGIDMGIGRQNVLATAKLTLDVLLGHERHYCEIQPFLQPINEDEQTPLSAPECSLRRGDTASNRRVTGPSIRGRLVRMNNGMNNGERGFVCIVELFGSDANGRKMIAWGRRIGCKGAGHGFEPGRGVYTRLLVDDGDVQQHNFLMELVDNPAGSGRSIRRNAPATRRAERARQARSAQARRSRARRGGDFRFRVSKHDFQENIVFQNTIFGLTSGCRRV